MSIFSRAWVIRGTDIGLRNTVAFPKLGVLRRGPRPLPPTMHLAEPDLSGNERGSDMVSTPDLCASAQASGNVVWISCIGAGQRIQGWRSRARLFRDLGSIVGAGAGRLPGIVAAYGRPTRISPRPCVAVRAQRRLSDSPSSSAFWIRSPVAPRSLFAGRDSCSRTPPPRMPAQLRSAWTGGASCYGPSQPRLGLACGRLIALPPRKRRRRSACGRRPWTQTSRGG